MANANQTGLKSDDYRCQCTAATFYFKLSAGKCVCLENAIWLGNTCVSCRDNALQSLGVRQNLTACKCTANMTWTQLNKCECIPNAIVKGKGCWSCNELPFTLATPASSTACGCEAPYVWSTRYNNCTCDANSLVIVNETGLFCYPCSAVNNATKKYTSKICQCLPTFSWSVADSRCICPSSRLYAPTSPPQCINCKSKPNGLGKYLDLGCICKGSYIWNSLTLSCSLCSAFPSATTKSGALSCNCSGKLTWNQLLYTCA